MSAIAGIYHLNEEPVNLQHGQILMKLYRNILLIVFKHGIHESIFLGCHAQWITPESVGEQLPFYDYERQCAITADAIIDNRKELFEKLQVLTSRSKSHLPIVN